MNLKALLDRLKELLDEHGDVQVYVQNYEDLGATYCHEPEAAQIKQDDGSRKYVLIDFEADGGDVT